MANFTTHIAAGTVVSGALATLTLAADMVAPENIVAVTLAGVLGSILPDIDLKDSRASKMFFAGLGIFFSFAALFHEASNYSIAELWIIWLGTLLLVRYGGHYVFSKASVHRGVWHSLIAGAFCSVVTAIVFARVLNRPEGVSWLAGGFMMIGYITHLVFDELYSVDIMDTRVKASFGTALKFFDKRYPAASIGMLLATVAAIMVAPSPRMFVDGVQSRDLWSGLHQRLLPQDKWFGLIAAGRQEVLPDDAITTGSIRAQETSDVGTQPEADAQSLTAARTPHDAADAPVASDPVP